MSWTIWMAVAVVLVTVWALVKRFETRLVLLVAGLVMALLSGDPMAAFRQFDKSMTNPNLIIAICSALGFAGVVTVTKCDVHLVALLVKPLKKLGVFLLPACMIVTGIVAVALPSTAGCVAAVGPTMIPLMLRAGFKPAAAAAAVVGAVTPAFLNPGVSHNVFIAKISNMEVMDFIGFHSTYSLMCGAILVVGVLLVCLVLRDNKGDANAQVDESKLQKQDDFTPSVLKALVMLVPIAILVCGNLWVPAIKMGVAQAMVIGAICALAVGRCNPQEFSKQFFNGMGKGYADVMGIIIAAGVFAAGLRAAGLIDVCVDALKNANEYARWGGALGPWIMGVITGSGDAATLAFNEAVTPHAEAFGMSIPGLGALAFLTGALGRTMSPLAGVTILVSGIAMVSPIEVIKRTALPCFVAVICCALLMV